MNKKHLKEPLFATGERVWRTYTGGKNLDKISGKEDCADSYFPELWLLSTVQAKNVGREDVVEGLCFVKIDDEKYSLKDIIKEYPNEMLGEAYNNRFEGSMGVLAKIIDSSERLTIQVHPTKEKAREYFNSEYGKTECWHILETRDDVDITPCMYIGFKENVTNEMFAKSYYEQDLETMLSYLHKIEVKKGETYIIYGGIPHAIGAGCTLIEVQEPTDYTLRTEKTTPAGLKIDAFACHQGIGDEKMLNCFSYDGGSLETILDRCKIEPKIQAEESNKKISLVNYHNTPCFKVEKLVVNSKMTLKADESFYGLYVVSGKGKLITSEKEMPINPNDQYFVSTICNDFTILSDGEPIEIVRFYGQQL
jgi:mannose-6-phosphate isomerase